MIIFKNLYLLTKLFLLDFNKKVKVGVNIDAALEEAIFWLCRAQDATSDNGVSEGYHLAHGWLSSYPETTGYIIETFLNYADLTCDESLKKRALLMADWLVNIQHEDGAIPDSRLTNKMVFDTGQVIFGFTSAFETTKDEVYKQAAINAGQWLLDVQKSDGSWCEFALSGIPHTYYSRVAWSLTKLHLMTGRDEFVEGCVKNIEWALTQQNENGWFEKSSFSLENHGSPYTHTIAYTIRGILEAGIYLRRNDFIDEAQKAMDGLLKVLPGNCDVSGSYDRNWKGNSHFSCLTGNAQLAIIFFKLYQLTGKEEYLLTGRKINIYLLLKQERRIKNRNIYGALAGSSPLWGEYIHFMYPNWATKFFIDSLLLEKSITNKDCKV